MKKKKIQEAVPVLLFLGLVLGMSLWSVVKPQTEKSEAENRYLSKKPKFSVKSLVAGEFGKKYETYLSDQFEMREEFINLKTRIEVAMGKSEINEVYLAKDDYLIRHYERDSFRKETEEENIEYLAEFAEKYTALMGEDHVRIEIVPSAATILADKLPAYASNYNETAFIEKLKEKISSKVLIDASEVLKDHKEEEIYYKTDHHWTSLGAYYGYQVYNNSLGLPVKELSQYSKEVVAKDFYGTNHSRICYAPSPDQITAYKSKDPVTYEVIYDRLFANTKPEDLTVFHSLYMENRLKEKDKYTYFLDGNHAIVDIKSSNQNGKKLLILKDSYSHEMIPFLAENYEQVTILDYRYFHTELSRLMPKENYTDLLVIRNTAKLLQDDTVFMYTF